MSQSMVMILMREKRERDVAAIQYSGIYEKLVMDR